MRVQIRLSFRKAKKKKKSDLSCTAYSGVWTQQSPRTAFGKKKKEKKSDMCAEGCSQSALKKTTPALGTMWQEKKKNVFRRPFFFRYARRNEDAAILFCRVLNVVADSVAGRRERSMKTPLSVRAGRIAANTDELSLMCTIQQTELS